MSLLLCPPYEYGVCLNSYTSCICVHTRTHTYTHVHTHTHTHTLQTTCFCYRPLPTNAGTSLCTTIVRMTSPWGTSLLGSVSSEAHLYMPETTSTFSCYHDNCFPPPSACQPVRAANLSFNHMSCTLHTHPNCSLSPWKRWMCLLPRELKWCTLVTHARSAMR